VPDRPQAKWVGRRLPPIHADPLRLSLREFKALLQRQRQIKALLLAQKPISGIGNIYCDEALYRAGIHPSARAGDLDAVAVGRLWRALRRVLLAAIQAGGSSIRDYRSADNTAGGFQRLHRVYARSGLPCRRCHTPIRKLTIAGRGTHICPNCQRILPT
jgi:formamidopyrimidine-DNA glycosylase